jgi:N-acetyl-anhydromuramyl-L-alanine amidase AmpD
MEGCDFEPFADAQYQMLLALMRSCVSTCHCGR